MVAGSAKVAFVTQILRPLYSPGIGYGTTSGAIEAVAVVGAESNGRTTWKVKGFSRYGTTRTFAAFGPLGPCITSNSTAWPVASD